MVAAIVVIVAILFGGGTTWFHYKSHVGMFDPPRIRCFVPVTLGMSGKHAC